MNEEVTPPELPHSIERDFEEDVKHLLKQVERVLYAVDFRDRELERDLASAAEQVSTWYEQTDDPVQNGWVDSQGRP